MLARALCSDGRQWGSYSAQPAAFAAIYECLDKGLVKKLELDKNAKL
jgi:hypothetical protein